MIDIDGSIMEGGGQLLRMAIAYSAVMGMSVRVRNIRARRKQPGLKPQHLTTLKAVVEMCRADVRGLGLGSGYVEFNPGSPMGGVYDFDIGTAGSIGLLLQCVAPIAAFANAPTRIRILGGTAVEWSPPIPILDRVMWEAARMMGFVGWVKVLREGFYPQGGGIVEVGISPIEYLRPIITVSPDRVSTIRGISTCGRLPEHVSERQARMAEAILKDAGYTAYIARHVAGGVETPLSPGSYICLWAEADPKVYIGVDVRGERGKPAEKVGAEAAGSLVKQLRTGAAVDLHTCDSLILWCSLAEGESSFTTSKLTMHAATAIELARTIAKADVRVEGAIGEPARIRCKGIGLKNTGFH